MTMNDSKLNSEKMREENNHLRSLLQQMLDVAEDCDPTGYADEVGFVDLDKLHAEVRRAIEANPQPTPAPGRALWKNGTPDVKEGGREIFWCATRTSAGKIWHRHLAYFNACIMSLSDSCDEPPEGAVPVGDDGDYALTGWYQESCDYCETQWSFDGEVLAWMRLPRCDVNTKVTHGGR